jgi:hypothetical protein
VKNGIHRRDLASARFSPEDTVTRDQAVTFLYRFAGSPDVSGGNAFRDVPGDAYYAPAVQWAVSKQVDQRDRRYHSSARVRRVPVRRR